MKPMKMPFWFNQELQDLFDKKRDRSRINPAERTLDALLRTALKLVPSELTGITTHKHKWEDVESLIEEACEVVKISKYNPRAIVGIKSGGAFIANYVAQLLAVNDVSYMRTVHYSENSRSVALSAIQVTQEAKVSEMPEKDMVYKRRVLLVDDQIGSGSSIRVAKSCLKGLGAKEVRSLCLFSPDLDKADYCARKGMAVYFPWGKDA
ncbi:MAG: phosphoribosyltransferase family protein [Candidatus Woesearchaeota archaeon]